MAAVKLDFFFINFEGGGNYIIQCCEQLIKPMGGGKGKAIKHNFKALLVNKTPSAWLFTSSRFRGIFEVEPGFVPSLNHLSLSVAVCFCLAGCRTDTSPQIQACSVAILLAPCASLSACLTHHSPAAQQVPTRHTRAQKVTSPHSVIM